MSGKLLARATSALAVVAALVVTAVLPAGATYPGPNGKIAFTATYRAKSQIYTMMPLGGEKKRITEPPRSNFQPSWNVDGKRIVFITTPPSRVQQVFTMNDIGNLRTQITTGTRDFADPAISPDDKWIVASGWRDGNYKNLWLIKADGTGGKRFTKFKANDVGASFSPDGVWVVWTRIRPSGASDIMTKKVDGSGSKQITGGNGDERGASFSPDGLKIAYTHIEGVKHTGKLWTMDPDGKHKSRLTGNPPGSMYDHASWSPNGDKIAFIRETDPVHTVPDIFTVNYPAGGGLNNLTNGRYNPFDVDWGVG